MSYNFTQSFYNFTNKLESFIYSIIAFCRVHYDRIMNIKNVSALNIKNSIEILVMFLISLIYIFVIITVICYFIQILKFFKMIIKMIFFPFKSLISLIIQKLKNQAINNISNNIIVKKEIKKSLQQQQQENSQDLQNFNDRLANLLEKQNQILENLSKEKNKKTARGKKK